MILAIDVGNSETVLGTIEQGEILQIVRIHTRIDSTEAEYGIEFRQLLEYYGIDPREFEGAILSSVVPPVTEAIRAAVERLTGVGCMVVGPGMKTGINVRIDDPGSLAADLAVGAVAAVSAYGKPVIVLNLGTATTMLVVDEKGSFRGGAIMPGVRLGLRALSEGTSLLPEISVTPPKKVIATNTADAMRSGAVYATAGMLDGMIDRMEEEMGCPCRAVATGSLAEVILPCCRREILLDENLLMKGLWILYDRNRKR